MTGTRGEKMREDQNLDGQGEDYPFIASKTGGVRGTV